MVDFNKLRKKPGPPTDVAIDCETLGLKYNAPIISIGAVAFNRHTGVLGQEFYQEIDFKSACKAGVVDGSTVAWWMRQGDAARQIFAEGRAAEKLDLATTLLNFTTWFRALQGVSPWCTGLLQDLSWIEHALDKGSVGLAIPWHYRKPRDWHTLKEIAEAQGFTDSDVPPLPGAIYHHALWDAKWLATAICTAFARINPQGSTRQMTNDEEY